NLPVAPAGGRTLLAIQEDGMSTYKVGYFVGSLSSTSINRVLSRALIRLAPQDLDFTELPIGNLPLYSPDFDGNYPPEPKALKAAIAGSQAVLFVTPEYNRSIPGALKNAIDWASRPWGQNSFDHMPAAVIGTSPGQIGTAVGQQSLRAVLSFCNARQMTAPEAYITFRPGLFTDDGEVTDESTAAVPARFHTGAPASRRRRSWPTSCRSSGSTSSGSSRSSPVRDPGRGRGPFDVDPGVTHGGPRPASPLTQRACDHEVFLRTSECVADDPAQGDDAICSLAPDRIPRWRRQARGSTVGQLLPRRAKGVP